MIQRIQTLFLMISIIAMVVMLFFPLWTKENLQTGDLAQLTPMALIHTNKTNVVSQNSTIYIAVLIFVSITFAFLSIFSYKNRTKQIMYNLFNILTLIGVIGCCIYFSNKGESFFTEPLRGKFGLGFFMPAIAVLMNSIANRFIRKDEKLVRSSLDRIR